jgi:transcriptional regulator of heat shock response
MRDAPLNYRYQEILTSSVRAYIDTGEPGGSRTLSETTAILLAPT